VCKLCDHFSFFNSEKVNIPFLYFAASNRQCRRFIVNHRVRFFSDISRCQHRLFFNFSDIFLISPRKTHFLYNNNGMTLLGFKTILHKKCTALTARFSKKSLGSDVGEIKKMSEKLKKKSVTTQISKRFVSYRHFDRGNSG
jgi:hypothetical protein